MVNALAQNNADIELMDHPKERRTKGLIIWTLLSRRLVVATTTKPNLGHLAPASELAGRHTLPF
jgi:hypothetical protein